MTYVVTRFLRLDDLLSLLLTEVLNFYVGDGGDDGDDEDEDDVL